MRRRPRICLSSLFPRFVLRTLEEPYRSRAAPQGTPRYWSWFFAAPSARAPLMGVYALAAEWRALVDPAIEPSVAQLKLAWWREELRRLAAGSPLHPITGYLAELPGASAVALAPLEYPLEAATAQVMGAPLEHAADLEPHTTALYAIPLRVAARLGDGGDHPGIDDCTSALGAAEYLVRAISDYRRDARSGRVPFAVDELLACGIDNDDLTAASPPPRLLSYLDGLRHRAVDYFSAATGLPVEERSAHRHLLVLATLGVKHLQNRATPRADFRLADLYNAWSAARHAAAAR